MTKYIHFTADEKQTARDTDLASFLLRRGEQLKRSGSEQEWVGHHMTIRGNQFYDQYTQEGGTAIDFVQREYSLSFQEAMLLLLSENGISKDDEQATEPTSHAVTPAKAVPCPVTVPEPERRPFILPEAHSDMRRVFGYLIKQRGIDPSVISYFAKKKLLYEDAEHHNAVFVGLDENGVPRHAHKKSTSLKDSSYRGNVSGSESAFSFHYIGRSNIIIPFEAPIDMLSFFTLYPERWQKHSYVALCSVSDKALFHQLETHPHLTRILFGLDRDKAGMEATERTIKKLHANGYTNTEVLQQQFKDWNEDLLFIRRMEAASTSETEKGDPSWAMLPA
ncbi:MAG: DUF3991 domain-containing protein [Clostridiales Family XIII bacterium]|nr:DUF3991 domain-containing protein [Clostridiales Family XIII bacterium]